MDFRKRTISILLCLSVMLLHILMPMSVYASEGEAAWSTDGINWSQGSFSDGISAINSASGGSLKLLSNVEVSAGVILSGGEFNIDLNGFNLTAQKQTVGGINTLTASGAETVLTILGSGSIVGGARGNSMDGARSIGIIVSEASLVIGGQVSVVGGSGDLAGASAIEAKGGKVTIKDQAVLCGGTGAVLGNGFGILGENTAIYISGNPMITGSADQHGVMACGGTIEITGTPTISGGTGSFGSSIGLYVSEASAVVSGGIYQGDDCGLCVQGASTVRLGGGSYSGGSNSVDIISSSLTVEDLLKSNHGFYYDDGSEVTSLSEKDIIDKVTVKSSDLVYTTTITATATIPAPEYTVTIPSTVNVGTLVQKTSDASDKIKTTEFTVSASGVENLFGAKKVVVTLSTENGLFTLADGEHLLNYTVYGEQAGGVALASGGTFAEFTAAGERTGRIEIDQSMISRKGNYAGTMTFNVSLDDVSS